MFRFVSGCFVLFCCVLLVSLFPVPVAKGQESRPGLVGGRADRGLPVLVGLSDELVGGNLGPGFPPVGLVLFSLAASFFLQEPPGLLFLREFFGNDRRRCRCCRLGGGRCWLGGACGHGFVGRRHRREDRQTDLVGDGSGRGLFHYQKVVVVVGGGVVVVGGGPCDHSDQGGVQQETPDGSRTEKTGSELRIVELEGPVFRSGGRIGGGSLGRIDQVGQDDGKCFEADGFFGSAKEKRRR